MKKSFISIAILLVLLTPDMVFSQQNDTSSYFPLGLWGIYIDAYRKPYLNDYTASEWNNEKSNWTNTNGNFLDCFIPDWKEDTVMQLCEEIGFKMGVARRKWNWVSGQFGVDTSLEYHVRYCDTLMPETEWRVIADRKINGIYSKFVNRTGFYSWFIGHENGTTNYFDPSEQYKYENIKWPKMNYIAGKIKQVDNSRKVIAYGDIQDNFLNIVTNLDIICPAIYVFNRNTQKIRTDQQTALGIFLGHVNRISNKLNGKTQTWYAVIQSQLEYPENNLYRKRRPTFEELRVQSYLALSRGARGVISYVYGSRQIGASSSGNTTQSTTSEIDGLLHGIDNINQEYVDDESLFGLVDLNRNKFTAATDPQSIPIYDNVSTVYNEIKQIGHIVKKLKYRQSFPNYSIPQNSANIYSVNTADGDTLIEIGTFKRMDQGTDSIDYFLIVNRLLNDANGNLTSARNVTIKINNGYYFIQDQNSKVVYPGTYNSVTNRTSFTISLNPGAGKLFMLKKKIYGTITANRILRDLEVGEGNAVLNSGVTLTVYPGTNLKFVSGASITCNGIITSEGTSSNRIVFVPLNTTETWGGLTFSGSGHSVLSYCDINKVNGYALSFVNCTGYPYVQFCNIANNTTGIRFDNSNGYCVGNTVENNTTGIEINNYATPVFGLSPYSSFACGGASNNKIRSNGVGVYCGTGVSPTIGSATNPYFYGNCLYTNTTYNLHLDASGTVYASNIYWGPTQGDKIFNEGGTLNCTSYCTSAPTSKTAEKSPEIAEGISFKIINNSTSSSSSIEDAKSKQMIGDYKGAYEDYQTMISSSTKESNLDEVYLGLLSLFRESNIKEIPEYLENMNSKSGNPLLESCIANCYAVTDNTDLTIEKLNKIITSYPKTKYALSANVQKFYQYYFKKNDITSAKKIYNDLTGDYKDDRNVIYLASLLNKSNESNKSNGQDQDNKTADKRTTPEGFYLSNYPNPFNPSTVIRYSIPKDLHVKLVVYDVTGKEVKTLVNETKSAGSYSVEFNAGKYASGVYYYKLEAGEYKNIQKMVVVK